MPGYHWFDAGQSWPEPDDAAAFNLMRDVMQAPRPFLAVSPTKDDFDVNGVKVCLTSAQRVYELLGASERLASYHPEHAHHFAAGGRRTAYAFLDRWLK